jgi:hypothetical protein
VNKKEVADGIRELLDKLNFERARAEVAVDEIMRLHDVIADLAEAARNACDAAQHPALTEALAAADAAILKPTPAEDHPHG